MQTKAMQTRVMPIRLRKRAVMQVTMRTIISRVILLPLRFSTPPVTRTAADNQQNGGIGFD